MKSKWPFGIDCVLLFLITLAFFIISRCGFFMGDDIAMGYGEFSSINDVLSHTNWFYMNLGGRYFSVASQYLFSGLIGKKIWFDVVNTLFFVLLILACGKLVGNKDELWIFGGLIFALLFWFLCPAPSESLFWMAGATTHLWANALSFIFLCLFVSYKDKSFSLGGKILLFLLSIVSAAEFIPCAAICGALVTYYAFHIRSLKGNAVPLVAGFVIGSMLVICAPGNFLRASDELAPFGERVSYLLSHPIQEAIKYKALWVFIVVMLWGWFRNREAFKDWMKSNIFLLLSLGWGIIAFSVVFRPANRALFFPEALSLVLSLRFLFDYYSGLTTQENERIINHRLMLFKRIAVLSLFFIFVLDAGFAVAETKKQNINNDLLYKKIVDAGGILALDRITPSHRMAYTTYFPKWVKEPLAERFGLDSIHIYPHYCLDEYYNQDPPLENVFIEDNYAEDDVFGEYAIMTVRVKEDDLRNRGDVATFHISYSRPRKWYKVWLDKLRNYQYDRIEVVERGQPDTVFDGYCYYVFWMKKENLKNLHGINVEFKQDNNSETVWPPFSSSPSIVPVTSGG